jgi:hypothetical protein
MKEAIMDISMNLYRLRRTALLACAALVFVSTVSAQDSDEDGVLPHNQASSAAEPGMVGIAAADSGLDLLEADTARLSIEALEGETSLDTSVSPADAMFIALGAWRYEYGYGVRVQAEGQLMLADGYAITLKAAPQAVARATVLIVHADSVNLSSLLAGTGGPMYVLGLGDFANADLGVLQGLVDQHANALAGFAVSLVDVSLDAQGNVHIAAARFTTDAGPIDISIH